MRVAWAARRVQPLADALAEDVVLQSPILSRPFVGRADGLELFEVLFRSFEDFEFTETFAQGNSQVLVWRGRIGGRLIDGVDLVRLDDHGQIAEVSAFIAPLVNLAAFAVGAGGPLAAKRGRIRRALTRILILPVRPMFRLIDTVASRLTMGPARE